jgi:hypothetical protein
MTVYRMRFMEIDNTDLVSCVLLSGGASNQLAHEWMTYFLYRGEKLHVLDCAIRLKPYLLAESTKGMDSFVLHQISVQRAFTPYQLLDAVQSLLSSEEELDKIYFFLAPSKQFFDGDVQKEERIFLLEQLANKLGKLKKKGGRFVISESIPKQDDSYRVFHSRLILEVQPKTFTVNHREVDNGSHSSTLLTADPTIGR